MTRSHIEIRTAVHSDIDRMALLLKQLFALEKDFEFNLSTQRKGLQMMLDGCGKHRVVKTAWKDGMLIGMCTAQTRISTASGSIKTVLEDLVVDRKYRGCGAGKALITAIETWAMQTGATHVTLLADRENQPALDFYRNRDYEQTQLVCLIKKLSAGQL